MNFWHKVWENKKKNNNNTHTSIFTVYLCTQQSFAVSWCSVKASVSGTRGSGFDPHWSPAGHSIVSLSKTLYPYCLVLVSTQKVLLIILEKECSSMPQPTPPHSTITLHFQGLSCRTPPRPNQDYLAFSYNALPCFSPASTATLLQGGVANLTLSLPYLRAG